MTGEAGLHEGEARVSTGCQYAGDEASVTIDVATLDTHRLLEQERPREPGGLAVERLAEFGCIDALEPDAELTRLALRNQLEGVAVGDQHDARVELRAYARLRRGRWTLSVEGVARRRERKQRQEQRAKGAHLPPVYLEPGDQTA